MAHSQNVSGYMDGLKVIGGRLRNKVELDGRITYEDEWTDATEYVFRWGLGIPPGRTYVNARVRIKNNDSWMYLLYQVEWPEDKVDKYDCGQVSSFWGTYGPPWEHSDHGSIDMGGWGGGGWDAFGWDDSHWYPDEDFGGTDDVSGAARYDGRYYWFEFRKALFTEDGHDWSLVAGDVVRVLIGCWDNSIEQEYHASVYIKIY